MGYVVGASVSGEEEGVDVCEACVVGCCGIEFEEVEDGEGGEEERGAP